MADRVALELSLLGGFGLRHGAVQLELSPRAGRLLAFLALREEAVREIVAARLWPDHDVEQARGCLRSTLWRLPKPSGRPLVSVTTDRLRLASDVGVDVTHLQAVVHRWRPDASPPDPMHVRQLSADLLPAWYDDWLVIERERQRQFRLHALERLSAYYVDTQRFDDAIEAGLEAIAADPLRESAHRCLIRVHLAEGNVSEAVRQVRRYQSLLTEAGIPAQLSPQMRELTRWSQSWASA